MAQRLAYLEAVVGADVTAFRRGMRDIRNEVGFLSETVSGLSGIGRSMTFMFTTPLVALGTAAINVAADFQASMYNINAIAGLTGQELDALSQRALEFGANTRSGAQAAADALYTVFSAGLTDVEQAFTTMEVMTYTAEAGLADLTTTTEAGLSVMLAYGDTTEGMAWRVSNAMTQMVAVGVGSMQDFAGALGSVVPTAQALNMDINELMGDMAFLTQRGLSAARAGTALNSALTALIKPSAAMGAAIHDLGANSASELIEKFGGVNGALKALIGHAGGSQEALAAMFGNIRGLRAINLFAGDLDMWNASMAEFNASLDGATMRAWESQMMSFSASWDRLKSAVMGAAIAVGHQFFPILQPLIDGVRDFLLQVTTMNPQLLATAVAFTTVAAALPPILWLVTSLISPFGLITGAMAAAGTAFQTNMFGMRDVAVEAVAGIRAAVEPLSIVFSELWSEIFPEGAAGDADEILKETKELAGTAGSIGDPMANITVDSPTSLWDVYENSGYKDLYSWDEFIKAAVDAGWEGGALTPDTPLVFTPIVETPEDVLGLDEQKAQQNEKLETMAEEIPQTFGDRLKAAWASHMPRIGAEIGRIFTAGLDWFDDIGGSILRSLTRGINSIDEGAIYEGIQAVLTGDWEWIAEQFGFGGDEIRTAVEGWKTKVEEALPEITAGLRSLITNAGHWILDEGVPLLARSFGFLAGRVGVLLNQAIQAGIAFFTGGSAAEASNAVGEYLDESVIAPFSEGMEDATAGSDLAVGIWNTLGAGIAAGMTEGVEGIDMSTIFAAIGVKLTEIGTWLQDEGIANISEGIGYLTGQVAIMIGQGLRMAFDAVAGFFGGGDSDVESSALTFGEDVATPFVTGFSTALAEGEITNPMDGFMTAIVGGLVLVATANMFLPVVSAIGLAIRSGVTIFSWAATGISFMGKIGGAIRTAASGWVGFGGVMTRIGAGLSTAASAISSGATWVVSTASGILSGIWGAVTATASFVVTGATGIIGAIGGALSTAASAVAAGATWVVSAAGSILGAIGTAIASAPFLLALGGITLGAAVFMLLSPEFKEQVRNTIEEGINSIFGEDAYGNWLRDLENRSMDLFGGGGDWGETDETTVTPTIDLSDMRLNEDDIPVFGIDNLVVDPSTVGIDSEGTYTLDTSQFTLDTPTDEEGSEGLEIPVKPVINLSGTQDMFAQQIAEGADFQTIIDEQLVPLEEYWTAMFGEAGTMALAFTGFSTTVSTGWADADTAANTFLTTIAEGIPSAQSTLQTFADSLKLSLGEVANNLYLAASETRTLVEQIAELVALDTNVKVQVSVDAQGTDGSHAKGLPSVPYDGYVAELHKGERVLTAQENKAYNEQDGNIRVPSNVLRGNSGAGGDTYQTNEMTITGVRDFDDFVREAKRRGLKIVSS